jgi:hypothetical protein
MYIRATCQFVQNLTCYMQNRTDMCKIGSTYTFENRFSSYSFASIRFIIIRFASFRFMSNFFRMQNFVARCELNAPITSFTRTYSPLDLDHAAHLDYFLNHQLVRHDHSEIHCLWSPSFADNKELVQQVLFKCC